MLTGDSEAIARTVARDAGIDSRYAALLPEEKVAKIEELEGGLPLGRPPSWATGSTTRPF